jgi:hypothetical protein
MCCKARTQALIAGLAALVVLLCCSPGASAAGDRAELLEPGSGYAIPDGSEPVRQVQRLLRRLGAEPGPVDGLYGPLTTAAVRRFQATHAVPVDGVVGPQTMGSLAAERNKLRKAKTERQARLERKSPAPEAESVTERSHARAPIPAAEANRAPPESSDGPSPELAAAVGGLALVLMLVVLWRLASRSRSRPARPAAPGPRLGLVCAGLLAAYVIGATTGALFATYASPDNGAEPSTATAEPRTR